MSAGLAIMRMDCCSISGSSRSRAISGRCSMSWLSCGFILAIALIVSGLLIICCTIGELISCCITSGFRIMFCCACAIMFCIGSPPCTGCMAPPPMPIMAIIGSTACNVCCPISAACRGGLWRQCTTELSLTLYDPTDCAFSQMRPAQTSRIWSFGSSTRPAICSLSSSTVADESMSTGNSKPPWPPRNTLINRRMDMGHVPGWVECP
mmetsp:Transcript_4113/g.11174  ORF Transcript_4113/g.11174 Transcript_4113/m.11174 type:complete len:208 (+) Transcript_4113:271-894(+)